MKTAEEIFRECLTETVGENCTDEQWKEVQREDAFKATIAAIERYSEQKLNKHDVSGWRPTAKEFLAQKIKEQEVGYMMIRRLPFTIQAIIAQAMEDYKAACR